jgi:hypothetical protein
VATFLAENTQPFVSPQESKKEGGNIRSIDHHVVVVADGHTLSDRPHLKAPIITRHHNWVWSHLFTNRSIRVATAAHLLDEDAQQA